MWGGFNLMFYLFLDVIQRVRRLNGEANEDDMRIGITEGTETIVVFLTRCIPQRQLDVVAINLNIGDVAPEHSGDVALIDYDDKQGDEEEIYGY